MQSSTMPSRPCSSVNRQAVAATRGAVVPIHLSSHPRCSGSGSCSTSSASVRRNNHATRVPPLHAISAAAAAAGAGLHKEAASGKVGIVIVDHGSRKAESNMQLFEFARLFQELTGAPVVECAHMEIAQPSIEHAIGQCVAKGVDSVVIAPYFLSRGRHIQEDIPQLVREAQEKYSGVRCVVAEPIGVDALMAQLICNRVNAAVAAQTA